MNNRSAQPA